MNTLDEARQLLAKHFGYREFLEGQARAIEAILEGRDAVVVMPTGGGKSLCYQLPALLLDGITVVVSPLIALMKDQVDGLVARNIPATVINSSLSEAEIGNRIARMARGEYRLVYIAPERFKSGHFIDILAPLSIALFAVDEAHCISQWGHDFRPDYLRMKRVLSELGHPQVIALTATATPEVRADIVAQLGLGTAGRQPPYSLVSGFARPNLTLAVTSVKSRAAKLARILEIVRNHKTGIVYCATRKNVELVAEALSVAGIACVAYHGGLGDEQRTRAQERFMGRACPVAVATNAFGMGVDRADLRFIVHHDIPGSVEAYYQEAGRAGRDGEPAHCELLFNYADIRTQEFFIEGANPTGPVILDVYATITRLCRKGPVTMPISEIAGHVTGAGNEMAIGTSLYLLERAGCIRRDYAQDNRTYTTHFVEPVRSAANISIDFEALAIKHERDVAKLRRMIDYHDSRGCRHHFILNYFGDPEAPSHCNACDHCLVRGVTVSRLPTEEETVIIQKALSGVGRMDGRYGRGRITQVLTGSHSKEVLDAGLDRLSTYGLLADEGAEYVWSLLEALIHAGCVAVSDGDYPTLSLTPLGHDVVHRRKVIPVAIPARVVDKPHAKKTAKTDRKAAAAAIADGCDMTLFDALRQWRRDKVAAMGKNVPAYVIYTDATLRELARLKPKNHGELLECRGIGPAKARQYGKDTLEFIRSFGG